MNKSNIVLGIIVFSIFLAAACSSSQPVRPPAPQQSPAAQQVQSSGNLISVSINGFKFNPADLNVKVGDTVIWTNDDSVSHTVESTDGSFKSDELSKGDTFKFTFAKAGKFSYKCGIHASMTGSVTVQ